MYHTIFFFGDRRNFESLADIASYYHYHYITGRANDLRVFYTYSHQRVEDDLVVKAFEDYRYGLHRRFRKKKDYTFRRGPVPGVSGRYGRGGRYQRAPRVKQMLMHCIDESLDSNEYFYAWDSRNRQNEDNWKSQRKTQYKPVYKTFE